MTHYFRPSECAASLQGNIHADRQQLGCNTRVVSNTSVTHTQVPIIHGYNYYNVSHKDVNYIRDSIFRYVIVSIRGVPKLSLDSIHTTNFHVERPIRDTRVCTSQHYYWLMDVCASLCIGLEQMYGMHCQYAKRMN